MVYSWPLVPLPQLPVQARDPPATRVLAAIWPHALIGNSDFLLALANRDPHVPTLQLSPRQNEQPMKYFVSYAYFLQNGGHGFGNIGLERSWPISGPDDIEDLTLQITDTVTRAMGKKLTLTITGWPQFEADIERIRGKDSGPSKVVQLASSRSE